jgi:hypothetical protein
MIEFKTFLDIPKDFTGICKTTDYGNVYHYKNGFFHNESGPAIIRKNGTKIWFINNFKHREDGPSTEYENGTKHWFYKGKDYGLNDNFTIESWKEKVEELKREEELKVFL